MNLFHRSCDQVRFVSVHEYLFLLKFIATELNKCGKKGLIYSAAAVSDFYIPDSEMVHVYFFFVLFCFCLY